MKNIRMAISSVFLTFLVIPTALHATPIFGTFGFNLNNVQVVPPLTGGGATPLDPYTGIISLGYSSVVFSGATSPMFPAPPTGTITGSALIFPSGTNGGNGTPFTLTFGDYGTFTETSNPVLISQTTNPQTLALLLNGTFTPGAYFGLNTGGPSVIVLTFTESTAASGTSYSGSGTFSIDNPIAPAPEPSSLALLGTGLLGVVGAIRRRVA